MSPIAQNVTEVIGNTPLVKLSRLSSSLEATVLVKMECMNPTSSVKDRIAISMIEKGEKEGLIKNDTVIIEPTSGNTGIGLAAVCAQRGYRLILTMPDTMSIERRKLLEVFGAECRLTPGVRGMQGAIEAAEKIIAEMPNSFMPQQFNNPANPEIHRRTTAEEIWRDTNGSIDIFVAAIGTGGTITGVGEKLKEYNPKLYVVGVEPKDSPVLSGGKPGPHKIQGIGAGFVPAILNRDIIDEILVVKDEDAGESARQLAKKEGILGGISAGANIWAAIKIASRAENKGKTIVTVLCDTGERYLSTWLFE